MRVTSALFGVLIGVLGVSDLALGKNWGSKSDAREQDRDFAPIAVGTRGTDTTLSFNFSNFSQICGLKIDWGDGSEEKVKVDGSRRQVTHQYENLGSYKIKVEGSSIFRGLQTVFSCQGKDFVKVVALQPEPETIDATVADLPIPAEKKQTFSVEDLRTKAEIGDVSAQLSLGKIYLEGRLIQQNFSEAMKWLLAAAEQGDPNAAVLVGGMYRNGEGVPKSFVSASGWYRIAAEAGNRDAQLMLGAMYDAGQGVPQSDTEAFEWFLKSAELGSSRAQYQVGLAYYKGKGTRKSAKKAFEYFVLSAHQKKNADSFVMLFRMLWNGEAVKQDRQEAFKMLYKAADMGHVWAQVNVAAILQAGSPPNFKEAKSWLELAAEAGDDDAYTRLATLYENGQGVSKDIEQAKNLYQKAVEGGNKDAETRFMRLGGNLDQLLEDIAKKKLESEKNPLGNGSYVGLGVGFDQEKRVDRIIPNSPSGQSGQINLDDQLIGYQRDGGPRRDVADWSIESVIARLPKEKGLGVTLFLKVANEADERKVRIEAGLVSAAVEPASTQQIVVIDKPAATVVPDIGPPKIELADSNVNESQGVIEGRVRDQLGVAEIRVDGRPIAFDSDGSFRATVYVPAEGADFKIVAINYAGLDSETMLSLKRNVAEELSNELTFAKLNPVEKDVVQDADAVALVIGVANYEFAPDAVFADRDAQIFADYAHLKLGIPKARIRKLVNEQASEREFLLSLKAWLTRAVVQNKTNVYVFFAGHGLGSDDGEDAYLIPHDGAPELLADTAVSQRRVFQEIEKVNPASATIFLDTCYSGDIRGGESRLISARPLAIKQKRNAIPDGFTVMTAAAGNQIAKPLDEVEHGLFSYFLMKGMEGTADSNRDGAITAQELHDYVEKNVYQQSSGSQIPELQGDGDKVLVRFQ